MQLHTSMLLSGILNKSIAKLVVFSYSIHFYQLFWPSVSLLPTSRLGSSQMEILGFPHRILSPVLICFPCSLPLSSYSPPAFTYFPFHTCSHSYMSLSCPLSFRYFLHGCVLENVLSGSQLGWTQGGQRPWVPEGVTEDSRAQITQGLESPVCSGKWPESGHRGWQM